MLPETACTHTKCDSAYIRSLFAFLEDIQYPGSLGSAMGMHSRSLTRYPYLNHRPALGNMAQGTVAALCPEYYS